MRFSAILALGLVSIGAVGSSLAQDEEQAEPETQVTAPVQAPRDTPAEEGVSEDVFTPSEEVEADTAVAFPTDI